MRKPQHKSLALFSKAAMQKCLAPLVFVLLMFGAASASAQERSADQWQYDFEVYGWLPQIDITTTGGS